MARRRFGVRDPNPFASRFAAGALLNKRRACHVLPTNGRLAVVSAACGDAMSEESHESYRL
jgi:hypothetical protein